MSLPAQSRRIGIDFGLASLKPPDRQVRDWNHADRLPLRRGMMAMTQTLGDFVASTETSSYSHPVAFCSIRATRRGAERLVDAVDTWNQWHTGRPVSEHAMLGAPNDSTRSRAEHRPEDSAHRRRPSNARSISVLTWNVGATTRTATRSEDGGHHAHPRRARWGAASWAAGMARTGLARPCGSGGGVVSVCDSPVGDCDVSVDRHRGFDPSLGR